MEKNLFAIRVRKLLFLAVNHIIRSFFWTGALLVRDDWHSVGDQPTTFGDFIGDRGAADD
jgi:hypothetical protein